MAAVSFLQAGAVRQPKALARDAQMQLDKAQRAGLALSMYSDLPDGEVAIEEFERFAMDRLRVLKGIDDARAKGCRPDQVAAKALELFEAHLRSGLTKDDAQRKDSVSHYVLRLAYCRTDELRRWFLAQECELFKARFGTLPGRDQRTFMAANKLPYQPLASDELTDDLRAKLHQTLLAVTGSPQLANAAFGGDKPHESFYRVPFEAVPDLVGARRVFLRGGWAYVPKDQVASLVVQPFRSNLSKALVVTARRWAAVVAPEEADRLTPIVEGLSQRYLGPDYTDPEKRGVVGAVTAADLPALARQSFPLCMLSMYQALHDSHDLKHEGRQQLGLFLKGIGLPLEEAIRFWRLEFAQKAPGDKFDKQYLYNIRHNYGKEGNRKDYTPYSCMRLIGTTPGVGQVHGCPYKTYAPDSLRAALGRLQVSGPKLEEALTKAKNGHYQLACAAVWEGKHGCMCETGINHPNQYYEESRKALGAPVQASADAAGTAGEAAAQPAAGEEGAGNPEAAPGQGTPGLAATRVQQVVQGQQQQSVPASALRGGGSSDEQPVGSASRAKLQRLS